MANDLNFYPIFIQLVLVLVTGFLYDIIGRRKTIFGAFFISGICGILMPYTSPSYPGLLVVRTVFSVCIMPIMANTFINDYIAMDSRGKGFAV